MDIQVLRTLSAKLGITDQRVVRKAEELLRLLAVQGGTGSKFSMSAKTVICLDIAAATAGALIDKNMGIKLSGMNRSQYVSTSQTVSHLLKISPGVCISDLCITHSATNARDFACQIIKEYEKDLQNKAEVDITLPVFQTAAVVAACGVMKIKVDKRKLYESSCSKRALYTKVVEAMTKVAERLQSTKSVKPGGKRSKTLVELVEDHMQDSSAPKKGKSDDDDKENSEDEQDTDFEAWKKKILDSAAASKQ
ncbi:origin recognition complex subunit 6 [Macrobrachium rosenbergii]|uniref:origin recognition complex subunit 6 n=1 Tax=Macrobrachium rosenbergii TaxID=79674 RepID=UPI0034D5F535